MPLVRERDQVLDVYRYAAERGWVVLTFCAENLTTIEAVLAAVKDHGECIGCRQLPVTIAITNLYSHRSQTTNYTHTGKWNMGLRLFLADLEVLTSPESPYADLKVMVHLDHIQHDVDEPLLSWNMQQFSHEPFGNKAISIYYKPAFCASIWLSRDTGEIETRNRMMSL